MKRNKIAYEANKKGAFIERRKSNYSYHINSVYNQFPMNDFIMKEVSLPGSLVKMD
jgi:hypothetical protein